jgi:hypothetical protein
MDPQKAQYLILYILQMILKRNLQLDRNMRFRNPVKTQILSDDFPVAGELWLSGSILPQAPKVNHMGTDLYPGHGLEVAFLVNVVKAVPEVLFGQERAVSLRRGGGVVLRAPNIVLRRFRLPVLVPLIDGGLELLRYGILVVAPLIDGRLGLLLLLLLLLLLNSQLIIGRGLHGSGERDRVPRFGSELRQGNELACQEPLCSRLECCEVHFRSLETPP